MTGVCIDYGVRWDRFQNPDGQLHLCVLDNRVTQVRCGQKGAEAPSLRCQQFKDVPWSHPISFSSARQPQLLGETAAEETLQNQASGCEIRLQSGWNLLQNQTLHRRSQASFPRILMLIKPEKNLPSSPLCTHTHLPQNPACPHTPLALQWRNNLYYVLLPR